MTAFTSAQEFSYFERIEHFDTSHRATTAGAQLTEIRAAAPRFRDWFKATGKPESIRTFDLVTVPYPTHFGLFRAVLSPAPFIHIVNRMIIIRWKDEDGIRRTLLWEPSDVEMGRNTPYFANLGKKIPKLVEPLFAKEHATVKEALATAGISPDEVDYIAFDHLHTQDVRRLIGTRGLAADLSTYAAVAPLFPKARMIVQRSELVTLPDLHPLQIPWYQPSTFNDLRPESLMIIDGDVLVVPGIALLHTPGHTSGNQTLVVNTDSGIWASSENAVSAESLTPEHSSIPGLRSFARDWGQEVVLNANTIEATAQQYNSLVKEKLIVDRSQSDDRFVQFFPTSELMPAWFSPGASPTFFHKRITHGALEGV